MVAAAVIGGSALLSAGSSLLGSSAASSAASKSAAEQLSMYNQTRSDLLPYNTTGQNALSSAYNLATGSPTGGGPDYVSQAASNVPGTMTQSQLEQTPGYQWQMQQGLKAVQSAAASRGLGVSGASIKGGATYATNLADSNYETQFNNQQSRFTDYLNLNTGQQSNLTNQFNRLNSLASLGENAAATTGQQGTTAASNYGNYTTQAGADTAAGYKGVSNALTSGVNNYLGYNAYQNSRNPTTGGYQGTQDTTSTF
jgi:hypothetical protein